MFEVYLREEFKSCWPDPFQEILKLQGEVYRELEARRTLRFNFQNHSYFIKIHFGVGWFEILENLIRFRLPVLGAENEYKAIQKCQQLNIDTMTIAAYGNKGSNPATRLSFIITEDLSQTISLEDFCANWKQQKPSFLLKYQLIVKLAKISKTLHNNGLNHRDYYLCHFLLDISNGLDKLDYQQLKLFLIDLHRSQIRNQVPQRWLIKDLASLYFSAMEIGLNQHDFLRFIKHYTGQSLRNCFSQHPNFWSKVQHQAQRLMERKIRKGDAL